MKIEKILKNKIYLDNEEVIDVNFEIITSFNLSENTFLSQDTYIEIIRKSMENKAIYILGLKELTTKELKLKLSMKYLKIHSIYIEETILNMKELGLLDDLDYAIRYIEYNINKGTNYIKNKLYLKGINRDDINLALENLEDKLEDSQKKEIKNFISKNSNLDKEKIIRKLLNRGYSFRKILEIYNESE